MTASPIDPAIIKVADAVGALLENWGFKRNMGRMWAVLYLEDRPLDARELGERLALSTGAVSMLLTEMQEWGAVKKTWVVGERREHFECETSIWKMVSRVFRQRELTWVRTAHEEFEAAGQQLGKVAKKPKDRDEERRAFVASRIASLTDLAQVGQHLLEAMLEGDSVDALPIKTVGELAKLKKE
jgi:HTH-type transcriptional regulator, glycine betaine synthesis regulator